MAAPPNLGSRKPMAYMGVLLGSDPGPLEVSVSQKKNRRKTARYRAALKSKYRKARLRNCGHLTKRKANARMKPKSGGWSAT